MPGGDLAPRLISPGYLAEQQRLHQSGDYGKAGDQWFPIIRDQVLQLEAKSVLDYGCGKGALGRTLRNAGIECQDYDPAIAGKDGYAAPADLVVCTDVLEHIESDLLFDVLNHLQTLTLKALFVSISTRPAGKCLSDGRNAHLIVKPSQWWQTKIGKRLAFNRYWHTEEQEFVALYKPKRP